MDSMEHWLIISHLDNHASDRRQVIKDYIHAGIRTEGDDTIHDIALTAAELCVHDDYLYTTLIAYVGHFIAEASTLDQQFSDFDRTLTHELAAQELFRQRSN